MSEIFNELKKLGISNKKTEKQIEREKRRQAHLELKQPSRDSVEKVVNPQVAIMQVDDQRRQRVELLLKEGRVRDYSGRRRFYFQCPDATITYLQLSEIAAALLERGKYAIASAVDDSFFLIKRSQALALEEMGENCVIFLQKKES